MKSSGLSRIVSVSVSVFVAAVVAVLSLLLSLLLLSCVSSPLCRLARTPKSWREMDQVQCVVWSALYDVRFYE